MPLPLLPSPHVFLSVVAHLIASPSGRYPSQGRERYLFALKNIYIGSRRIIVTFYHRVYLYNLRITSIFEFSSPREPRVVKEEMEGGLAFEAKGKRGRGIRSLAEFTHDRVETRACIGLRPHKDQDFTGESTFPTKGSEREQVSRSRNRGNLLFLLRFIYIYIYVHIDRFHGTTCWPCKYFRSNMLFTLAVARPCTVRACTRVGCLNSEGDTRRRESQTSSRTNLSRGFSMELAND